MKKKIILSAVLSLAVICTACSTAWVSTLDSILAAAAPALIDILQIASAASGTAMNSNLAAKINTDAADIKTLAAAFAADGGSTACQTLQNAIATYQADQNLVLQVAQVSDPNTQNKIALLLDLVAGTVSAITAVIPSCQMPSGLAKAEKVGPPLTLRNFVASYNAILKAKTGNPKVDALTPKLVIHNHGRFLRWASVGILN